MERTWTVSSYHVVTIRVEVGRRRACSAVLLNHSTSCSIGIPSNLRVTMRDLDQEGQVVHRCPDGAYCDLEKSTKLVSEVSLED